MSRSDRHLQILRIAGELFAERGYQNTSMSELARRVGVSKPVIYDLVGSKEELFQACADSATKQLAETVVAAGAAKSDLREKFGASATAAFTYFAKHHRMAPVMFPGSTGEPGDRAAPFRRSQAEFFDAALSSELDRRGVDVDPRKVQAAAHAAVGAAEGLLRWWVRHPDLPPEILAAWLTTLTLPGFEALLFEGG